MNQKISDFRIADYMLRLFCKSAGCHFVDLPIEFVDTGESASLTGSGLQVPRQNRLSKTLFAIVSGYILNVERINGAKTQLAEGAKAAAVNLAAAMVRDFITSSQTFSEAVREEPVQLRLNRDPLVWFILRDIVCPAYQKPLKNLSIMAGSSGDIDAAQYVDQETYTAHYQTGYSPVVQDRHVPLIFVNMDVRNYSYRAAFVLHEALKAHDLNPKVIIRDLLTKTEISEKFLGITAMALGSEESVMDFIMMLGILGDFDSAFMMVEQKKAIRTAQVDGGGSNSSPTAGGHSSFWQLGLIEKMIEPARGSDWSTYFRMKPWTDELWDKVEQEKRRLGLAELPMELLLRVQSEEHKTRPDLIIQGLLADNRVW